MVPSNSPSPCGPSISPPSHFQWAPTFSVIHNNEESCNGDNISLLLLHIHKQCWVMYIIYKTFNRFRIHTYIASYHEIYLEKWWLIMWYAILMYCNCKCHIFSLELVAEKRIQLEVMFCNPVFLNEY